jgi:hypothetical protein
MSPYPVKIRDMVEILVEHSESSFLTMNADCEEAYAYFDQTCIEPREIFVAVPVKHRNNKIKLINPSNLPIHFEWKKIKENNLDVSFTPNQGTVNPRSFVEITYSFLFHTSNFTLIFSSEC